MASTVEFLQKKKILTFSLHLRDTYGQSHYLILISKRKTSPSEYVSKILLVETLRE